MSRVGVAVMTAALALYLAFAVQRAFIMFATGEPVGIAFGVGLLVLPLIGAWVLVREVMFGVQSARLTRRLEDEDGVPDDDVALTPSGRVVREEAAGLVQRYADAAAAAPEDWRSRLRLGIVQRAAGQLGEARASVRAAIRLEKTAH
ncbi:hypothetical protein GCM10025768_12290 [Microbacterium pseudoresistens]